MRVTADEHFFQYLKTRMQIKLDEKHPAYRLLYQDEIMDVIDSIKFELVYYHLIEEQDQRQLKFQFS